MNNRMSNGRDLLEYCDEQGITIAEAMIRYEISLGERNREAIIEEMRKNLSTMRLSVKKGIEEEQFSVTGLTGNDSGIFFDYAEKSLMGSRMARAVASSMAVVEINASMGRIVAAPTAGASGILPGVLLVCGEDLGWDDDKLVQGLFAAGAVGMIIAQNATISGAEGGCQAETGVGAAMTAAALTELCGGTPQKALDAAAIAMKNVMGLVCDPVAGLVECPCIKRNAIGAANAMLSADMALAGVKSIIPFDEVVGAMRSVGRLMSTDLRETARGGLAATPTAKQIESDLGLSPDR